MGTGYCDLHCHLLYGLDDGAKTPEDTLEMARALVDLGFSDVAPSPHARGEYPGATAQAALARLEEVRALFAAQGVPLALHPNAENFFLEEDFLPSVGTPRLRGLGAGACVLVEAPYTSPLPALSEIIFRMKLKGITPLIAHPERCLEFERKGRAAEVVNAGAYLQLDIGALIGRYGPAARKLSRGFLSQGLYAVGATDLHAPVGAREWVGRSLAELRSQAGEAALEALMGAQPRALLRGELLS